MADLDSVPDRRAARPSRAAPGPHRPPPGRGPGGPRGAGDEPTIDPQAAFKGILIVLVTMAVGAFVFVQGLTRPAEPQSGPTPVAAGGDTVASTEPLAPPPSSAATTPTTVARPPATRAAPRDLMVVVGNALDPAKPVAGTVSSKLGAAGYTTVRRLNATRLADRSTVHYADGVWREDALAVARALGIPETDVTAVPNPPPVNAPESNVYVIVGREPRALGEAGPTATTR